MIRQLEVKAAIQEYEGKASPAVERYVSATFSLRKASDTSLCPEPLCPFQLRHHESL